MKLISVCNLLIVLVVAAQAAGFIKSNAVTRVELSENVPNAVHLHRQRREAQPLTAAQIEEVVNRHNVLRAKEGADNMELMVQQCHCNYYAYYYYYY